MKTPQRISDLLIKRMIAASHTGNDIPKPVISLTLLDNNGNYVNYHHSAPSGELYDLMVGAMTAKGWAYAEHSDCLGHRHYIWRDNMDREVEWVLHPDTKQTYLIDWFSGSSHHDIEEFLEQC